MKIYILPISGGGFAPQLGLLVQLFAATKTQTGDGYRPDLVLASSGGNVASYIAMMGNWTDTSIIRNCQLIDSSIFIQSWTPPFFPTWILFPITGSLYKAADGIEKLYSELYNKTSIQRTEIWTGTYNETKQKAVMFCNRSRSDSLIQDDGSDTYIYDQIPSIYLEGNIQEIGKACYASAAMPFITPGVVIRGDRYLDGGAAYSSPLIPMESKLCKVLDRAVGSEPIQIFYFCSYDMDMKFNDSMYSSSIGLLVHSSLLQDRACALSVARKYGKVKDTPKIYNGLSPPILRDVLKVYEKSSYLIMFFPKGSPTVNVTNFAGKDVCKIIKDINYKYSAYLYLIE